MRTQLAFIAVLACFICVFVAGFACGIWHEREVTAAVRKGLSSPSLSPPKGVVPRVWT